MIKYNSTKHGEILLNTDNVLFFAPSDNGSVAYFVDGSLMPSNTKLSDIEYALCPEEEFTKDGFPGWLPKNPSGNVDKRTNAFKNYIASLEQEKL